MARDWIEWHARACLSLPVLELVGILGDGSVGRIKDLVTVVREENESERGRLN